jgi:hypothetical protein
MITPGRGRDRDKDVERAENASKNVLEGERIKE